MKKIFKYLLSVIPEQEIELTEQAHILAVQAQKGEVFLWAFIDDEMKPLSATIYIVGTGHPATHVIGSNYLGTFQLHKGDFVGHVFVKFPSSQESHDPT